ncbi:putative MFS family arabinose efflux permease [Krasilnikovia cinnamomea]|uniref:Putative MFS family arabinose efflux permease n=1 Tax=Krasilnikovia cinnamomea TaxID=349313 RepID=A0A4Q7ZRQ0_9ACTN|nr:putative MFS family arabinose efflux permease [Krasilnikovia cinnamomea]
MSDPAAEEAEQVPLGRNRDFKRLWLSQALSATGSRVSFLVYPLLILALFESVAAASAVAAVCALSEVVARLPAGVLLDRLQRRSVMLWCETARILAMVVAIVTIATGSATLWLIMLVAAVDAGGAALFVSAERTALRHIVPMEQIQTAAARNEARTFTAELLGPALGGVLLNIARVAPFIFNAFAYSLSFLSVLAIRKPLQSPREQDGEGVWASFLIGAQFLFHQPFLRALAAIGPLLNMAFTGTMFVVVVVLNEAGVPSYGVGVCLAVVASGGILGAVLAPMLQRKLPPRRLVVILSWTSASMVALCIVLPAGYWMVVPLPILVLFAPPTTSILFGHQTAVTPDHLHGRVVAAMGLLISGLNPFAPLLAGLLLETWNHAVAFAAFTFIFVIASIIVTFSKGVRMLSAAKFAPGIVERTSHP